MATGSAEYNFLTGETRQYREGQYVGSSYQDPNLAGGSRRDSVSFEDDPEYVVDKKFNYDFSKYDLMARGREQVGRGLSFIGNVGREARLTDPEKKEELAEFERRRIAEARSVLPFTFGLSYATARGSVIAESKRLKKEELAETEALISQKEQIEGDIDFLISSQEKAGKIKDNQFYGTQEEYDIFSGQLEKRQEGYKKVIGEMGEKDLIAEPASMLKPAPSTRINWQQDPAYSVVKASGNILSGTAGVSGALLEDPAKYGKIVYDPLKFAYDKGGVQGVQNLLSYGVMKTPDIAKSSYAGYKRAFRGDPYGTAFETAFVLEQPFRAGYKKVKSKIPAKEEWKLYDPQENLPGARIATEQKVILYGGKAKDIVKAMGGDASKLPGDTGVILATQDTGMALNKFTRSGFFRQNVKITESVPLEANFFGLTKELPKGVTKKLWGETLIEKSFGRTGSLSELRMIGGDTRIQSIITGVTKGGKGSGRGIASVTEAGQTRIGKVYGFADKPSRSLEFITNKGGKITFTADLPKGKPGDAQILEGFGWFGSNGKGSSLVKGKTSIFGQPDKASSGGDNIFSLATKTTTAPQTANIAKTLKSIYAPAKKTSKATNILKPILKQSSGSGAKTAGISFDFKSPSATTRGESTQTLNLLSQLDSSAERSKERTNNRLNRLVGSNIFEDKPKSSTKTNQALNMAFLTKQGLKQDQLSKSIQGIGFGTGTGRPRTPTKPKPNTPRRPRLDLDFNLPGAEPKKKKKKKKKKGISSIYKFSFTGLQSGKTIKRQPPKVITGVTPRRPRTRRPINVYKRVIGI